MTNFNALIDAMGTHSISQFPLEACGIITKDLQYIPCKNISKAPKTSFVIDPRDMISHVDNILGFFHSHPGSSDPIPSSKDMASTVFSEYLFVVGFSTKFYKYWLEENNIRFEPLHEDHFKLPSSNI